MLSAHAVPALQGCRSARRACFQMKACRRRLLDELPKVAQMVRQRRGIPSGLSAFQMPHHAKIHTASPVPPTTSCDLGNKESGDGFYLYSTQGSRRFHSTTPVTPLLK